VRVIRTGISRTVILIGRWAVKVPSARGHMPGGPRGRLAGFCHGILDNQSEATWSTFEPWHGRIAPVRRSWLLGIVNVYPRCTPPPTGVQPFTMDVDPGDGKPDNFGILNGRLVRVDYSMGMRRVA
jgi:hypothetical protein